MGSEGRPTETLCWLDRRAGIVRKNFSDRGGLGTGNLLLDQNSYTEAVYKGSNCDFSTSLSSL